MQVRFWEPSKAFLRIESEVMPLMRSVLANGDLVMRQEMADFEERLAAFVGTRYAVGVGNCSDGLRLILEALGITPGDEVITVAHTFVATMAAIHHVGADLVLVDVGEDHNMDVSLVEAAITPRTRAIIPVHMNGRLTRMDELTRIAEAHNLMVIEDAAQALGAALAERRGGAWGIAGAFSFYPAKMLGAYGDAGAIVTSDAKLATKLRALRDHGRVSKTELNGWGWNSRLDNLQAAVLALKLTRVPAWIEQRRRLASLYEEALAEVEPVKRPPAPDGPLYFDVYQNYVIEAERRDELVEFLAAMGIETLVAWPIPMHRQPIGLEHYRLPKTESLAGRVVSLPMNNELDEGEVLQVAQAVREFYS